MSRVTQAKQSPQVTLEFCERILLAQLSQPSRPEIHLYCKTTESVCLEGVDEMVLRSRETELEDALKKLPWTSVRVAELQELLRKVRIGGFKPFCLQCGIPITEDFFEAYPAEECPVCRAKKSKTTVFLRPKRDDSTLGLISPIPEPRRSR